MSLLKRILEWQITRGTWERAERSRFIWAAGEDPTQYRLRLVGFINGLLPEDVRLTLIYQVDDPPPPQPRSIRARATRMITDK